MSRWINPLVPMTETDIAEWDRRMDEQQRACDEANRTGQPVDYGDRYRAWPGFTIGLRVSASVRDR